MHDDPALRYQSAMQLFAALASVQCDPEWECVYSATEATWKRRTSKREFEVVWDRTKGDWLAQSRPLQKGNKRTLGSGSGLKRVACIRALKNFFAT